MRTSLAKFGLAMALPLALAACVTPEDESIPSIWRDDVRGPIERQIDLNVQEATHIVQAGPSGLAPGEAGRLGAFLTSQGSPWSMDVRVQPLSPAGAAALDQTYRTLVQLGVQPVRITGAPQGAGEGDIAITTRNVVASAKNCPDWRRANLMDLSEYNSSNFGCATADVLAKMIADPRELSTGRAMAPGSGAHAAGAVSRYRTDQVKPLIERESAGGGGGGGK